MTDHHSGNLISMQLINLNRQGLDGSREEEKKKKEEEEEEEEQDK